MRLRCSRCEARLRLAGSGPPIHAVAGSVSGGGLVGGDGNATIFGIAASDVAAVKVELHD